MACKTEGNKTLVTQAEDCDQANDSEATRWDFVVAVASCCAALLAAVAAVFSAIAATKTSGIATTEFRERARSVDFSFYPDQGDLIVCQTSGPKFHLETFTATPVFLDEQDLALGETIPRTIIHSERASTPDCEEGIRIHELFEDVCKPGCSTQPDFVRIEYQVVGKDRPTGYNLKWPQDG